MVRPVLGPSQPGSPGDMPPVSAPLTIAPNPCHNCRRQRRRCDRTEPYCTKCASRGIQCLGYGKLLLWTGGAASRGKKAGDTSVSSLLNDLTTQRAAPGGRETQIGLAAGSGNPPWPVSPDSASTGDGESLVRFSHGQPEISTPWVLTDPLFQDLKPSHRGYLDYCV